MNELYTVFYTVQNYAAKTKKKDGKSYLVVPVVAMVEGVLNGSHGPVLYMYEVIKNSVADWEGVPVPINHPVDEKGNPVSCNGEAAKMVIGTFENVKANDKKRALVGEIWIDTVLAESIDEDTLTTLNKNKMMEVSTGLRVAVTKEIGEFGGKEYFAVATKMVPDHLALLPNKVGACSIDDGCGVRANQAQTEERSVDDGKERWHGMIRHDKKEERLEDVANVRGTARTPKYDGTETSSWADVDKSFEAYRDGYYKNAGEKPAKEEDIPTTVTTAPAAMKRWIVSKTLLGEPDAKTVRDLIFFPVVNPSTDALNEGALKAVLGGRGASANIPETAKTSAQNKAKSLLKKEFGMKETTANSEEEDVANKEGLKVHLEVHGAGSMISVLQRVRDSIEQEMRDRLALRTDLVGNELSLYERQQAVGNALRSRFPDYEKDGYCYVNDIYPSYVIYETGGGAKKTMALWKESYAFNAETGVVTLGEDAIQVRERRVYEPITNEGVTTNKEGDETMADTKHCCPDKVAALVGNKAAKFTANDAEWLNNLTAEQLSAIMNSVATEVPVANQETPPAPKPVVLATMEEVLANVSSDLKPTITDAMAALTAQREGLVANVKKNEGNQFSDDELRAMPLAMLGKLATIANVAAKPPETPVVPVTPKPPVLELPVANFKGRGGNTQKSESKAPVLSVPNTRDMFKKA